MEQHGERACGAGEEPRRRAASAADEAKGIRVGTAEAEAEAARVRVWSGALGFVCGNPHDPGPRPSAFTFSRADLY